MPDRAAFSGPFGEICGCPGRVDHQPDDLWSETQRRAVATERRKLSFLPIRPHFDRGYGCHNLRASLRTGCSRGGLRGGRFCCDIPDGRRQALPQRRRKRRNDRVHRRANRHKAGRAAGSPTRMGASGLSGHTHAGGQRLLAAGAIVSRTIPLRPPGACAAEEIVARKWRIEARFSRF